MSVSRRGFLALVGAGVVAGCSSRPRSGALPGPLWHQPVERPRAAAGGIEVLPAPLPPTGAVVPAPAPQAPAMPPLRALPRSQWTRTQPLLDRINPMNGVQRITVHHEGWNTVWFSDAARTADRLETIRQSHLDRLHAGDIGYHFVIDRAGRVWQGRDLRYQGAHVRNNNEHNVGIMVLGNFDNQAPSDAQLASLRLALATLARTYRVPLNRVYTHQELNPTACPGKLLQPRMVSIRRSGLA